MNNLPIVLETQLTIKGDAQHTLVISNDGKQAVIFDFNNRKSLLYFLGALPKHINLLKQRKSAVDLLKLVDQDLIIKIAGKTSIYKKAKANKIVYTKDYATAFSIFWLFLKRSIFRIMPLKTK